MISKANIGGVPVHGINLTSAVQTLADWIHLRERHYVYLCNIHGVVSCLRDPALRQAYIDASLVTPDGMPLVALLQIAGLRDVGRVYGPDLMLAACEDFQRFGYRHFFYGGAPGIADRLAARLRARYPEMQVAGTWSPPFRPLTPEEDRQAIARINESSADVVWVGLGAPKQERWIAEHRRALSAPLLIGVGYAFDVLSGTKPQAPAWMRNGGLEWAFRFASEPRRLWPRIFIDGPLFLAAITGQLLGVERLVGRSRNEPVTTKRSNRAQDVTTNRSQ